MNLSAVVLAIGVMGGGLLLVPPEVRSTTWLASMVVLCCWIASTPALFSRGSRNASQAGWLGALGVGGLCLGTGLIGAVLALTFSLSGYSQGALAILVLSTGAAIAALLMIQPVTLEINAISAQSVFASSHTEWQQELEAASSRCADRSRAPRLIACAEAARYSSRDRTPSGHSSNAPVAVAVARLCDSGSLSDPEFSDCIGDFHALLAQREIQLRIARA